MTKSGNGQTGRPTVAIIGGGISGLAAAWYLSQASNAPRICLLEACQRVGGVLESVRDDGYLVERSADNFATLIPDALEFCKAIGFSNELISPNAQGRQAFVLNRGRVLPIPAGFSLMQPTRIGSILSTKTLSWGGKLRLASEYFISARKTDEDESLESFAVRRLGREAFENLVEPIVSGIFTADPARLSMQATLPQFVDLEKKHGGLIRGHLAARRDDAAAAARRASGARYDQFLAPRDGMTQWLEHIRVRLPQDSLRLGVEVQKCRRFGSESCSDNASPTQRWMLETTQGPLECDGVIVALPTYRAAKLIRDDAPAVADMLAAIEYASSAVAVLIVDRAEIRGRIDGFGLIVPQKENRHALAISYTSNKYPGRVPDDQIMLRVFLGGAMQPDVLEKPDVELLTLAQAEVREILAWKGSKPRWTTLVRWHNAMPQYHVGHVQRIERLRALLNGVPTLKLCGAGYAGVGIPQCVRSGRIAAQDMLSALGIPLV